MVVFFVAIPRCLGIALASGAPLISGLVAGIVGGSVVGDLLEQVNETSEGQHPFAVILSCIDSRTSAELIFDQGLGDVFSVRIAGNVVNDDILGSMEFACKLAGSKLIVLLGHHRRRANFAPASSGLQSPLL